MLTSPSLQLCGLGHDSVKISKKLTSKTTSSFFFYILDIPYLHITTTMPPKQKTTKGATAASGAGKAIADPRFSNISSDPRYRLPSKKQTHVKLDKRFSHMMNDEDFTSTATVDRYGRKVPKSQGRKKLERLYEVADEDDEEDDGEDVGVDVDDDDDVQRELARIEKKFDPARQGGFDEESSSEEESSSDEEEEEEVEDMVGDEGDGGDDTVVMGEVSRRLAIVNLDWDNIRATDLMAVASSFAPPEGRILDVTVYPSEYGKERMEREEQEGPDPELFANSRNARKATLIDDEISEASDSDIDEEEKIKKSLIAQATAGEPEIDSRALRAYQLSRLRYYYAVVTCDSENTASALYNEMDGREYLSTSNFFDMRFVPDDVEFDDDKPRDTCTKVPDGYKPNEFVTEALTHSKVRLTWDEEDTNRKEVQKRAFSRQEVDENDLKAYIGSDSSDDDEEDDEDGGVEVVDGTTGNSTKAAPKQSKAEAARAKMRAALGLAETKTKAKRPKANGESSAPTGGMQITFTAGLSTTATKPTTDNGTTTNSSIFKNKPEDVIEETTLERYKRKEKERKARRKAKNKGGDDEEDVAAPTEKQEAVVNGADETQEDDPFNDPFFTDPAAANAAAKKAAKKAKRDAAAAEIAAAAKAKQKDKAELELLMASDGADGTSLGERSFSMAAIRKAEKDAKKNAKGKKKKAKKGWKGEEQVEDDGPQVDDFVMDVTDDRFKEAFENHDFAIDPSNPKFVETEGMKKLLQEGRKRREKVIGEDVVNGKAVKRKAERGGDGEVDDLVEKIKRRKAGVRS